MNLLQLALTETPEQDTILDRLSKKLKGQFPQEIVDQLLYKYVVENFILGFELDGYGLFENGENISQKEFFARLPGQGSIHVRIDYSKEFMDKELGFELTDQDEEASRVYDAAMHMITNPHDQDRNPPDAGIKCVRVTVVLPEGRHFEQSYFPTMYDQNVWPQASRKNSLLEYER